LFTAPISHTMHNLIIVANVYSQLHFHKADVTLEIYKNSSLEIYTVAMLWVRTAICGMCVYILDLIDYWCHENSVALKQNSMGTIAIVCIYILVFYMSLNYSVYHKKYKEIFKMTECWCKEQEPHNQRWSNP